MGFEHYIVLERDIGVSADIYPTILFRFRDETHTPNIQELELKLGLVPLPLFNSSNPQNQKDWASVYGYEYKPHPELWFEAAEGLKTIDGLLGYFLENIDVSYEPNFIKALQMIKRVLEEAESQKVRFHFEIAPTG
jgi:hypothetical protein